MIYLKTSCSYRIGVGDLRLNRLFVNEKKKR